MDKLVRGGYLLNHVKLLNGRLFNKLLAENGQALYTGEQGKILSCLWDEEPLTATDMAIKTGLANNTLTKMLKRLEDQGLIRWKPHPKDKRKRLCYLTDLGRQQEGVGQAVSRQLGQYFYQGFSQEEIAKFEADLMRISTNLQQADPKWREKR